MSKSEKITITWSLYDTYTYIFHTVNVYLRNVLVSGNIFNKNIRYFGWRILKHRGIPIRNTTELHCTIRPLYSIYLLLCLAAVNAATSLNAMQINFTGFCTIHPNYHAINKSTRGYMPRQPPLFRFLYNNIIHDNGRPRSPFHLTRCILCSCWSTHYLAVHIKIGHNTPLQSNATFVHACVCVRETWVFGDVNYQEYQVVFR